jgi:hypothetical protein
MFRRIRRAHRVRRPALAATVALAVVLLVLIAAPAVGYADPIHHLAAAPKSINQVIAGLRNWLMGILAGIATLFLILAGVYYATAGGDPGQVEKAKGALRNALVGYAIAVLAPVLLAALQGIVGS